MTSVTQPPPVPPPRLDRAVPECPYVGLVPFDESDAPYFFGRQRECEVVVANLAASRLTLLYAASGVGKSSVLRAGVLPRLAHIAEESYADLGVPDAAVAYVREWSLAPLDAIATAVLRAVSRVPGASPVEVSGSPRLDVPWLRKVLQRSGVAAIYLVLDQFEEYFLYHPDDRGEDGLAGALGHILSTRDLPVNVLLSIREDALAELDRFKGRVPRLYNNYLRLAHLGRDAAKEAIKGPLDHYNEVVPPDSAMDIEDPELTVALLDQVRAGHLVVAPEGVPSGGAAGGREDIETPYLQLVLTRLWEAERASGSSVLRRSTLDELGGAQMIVQTHLHAVMAGLAPEQLEVAAAVFRCLVTTSGSKIALTAQDLADLSGVPVSSVEELLQSLSSGRQSILRPVPSPDGVAGLPRYEIFHDVMGAAVLDWRRQYVAQRAQAEAARKLVAEREEARAEAQATRRRLRQTRLFAASLAVVLLIASVLGVLAYRAYRQVEKEQSLSEAAATVDENPAESLDKAVEAYRISPDQETSEAVLTAASVPRGRVIAGSPGEPRVAGMVLTPDQRHVVTYDARGGIRVIGDDGRLTKAARASHLTGTVLVAATSPNASQVALGTDRGSAAVLDVSTGREVNLTTDGSPISAIWWLDSSPDNLVLVVNSSDLVTTYSATTGQQVTRLPGPVSVATPLANARIVTADHDSRLRVWNARTAEKVAESSPLPGRVKKLQRYGNEVVGVTEDHNLLRWDWRAGPQPHQYPLNFVNASTLMVVNEDTHTVALIADKAVGIYNLDNGSLLRSLPKQPSWVSDMELDPRGRWIATAGDDGLVRMWSAKGDGSRATYEFVAQSAIRRVNYLRDGSSLIFLDQDGTVWFCDVPQLKRFDLGDNWMLGLDLSADGRWIAAASADGTVHIVDPAAASDVPIATVPVGGPVAVVRFDPTDPHRIVTLNWFQKEPMEWHWDGRGAERLPGFETPPRLFSFSFLTGLDVSRDGKWVAAEDDRGNVYLWDAHTGKLINAHLMGSGRPALRNPFRSGIAFDPAGRMLAATSRDGVLLKELNTGKEPQLLPLPDPTEVAFDQRGNYLVGAAGNGGVLRVWTRDGRLVHDFDVGGGTVGRPSFSGDGRWVAVGTGEGIIDVWDVHSGLRVLRAREHSDLVTDVLFLPGGPSRLVSASDDSTVAVFRCPACDDPDAVIRNAERWVIGSN